MGLLDRLQAQKKLNKQINDDALRHVQKIETPQGHR